MSKASSTISTPTSTPAGTSESKKSYLSSPFSPEDKLAKKKKAYNDSMESLDKSDVSVSRLDPVYEMETVGYMVVLNFILPYCFVHFRRP